MKARLQLLSSLPNRPLLGPTQASQPSSSTRRVVPRPTPPRLSCSRWFSCTCCDRRQRTGGDAFFTPKSVEAGRPGFEDTEGRILKSTSAGSSTRPATPSDWPSNFNLSALPPPLPYSPESIPFRRQLDALSYAVQTATPKQDLSWAVFQSIHPSLGAYVPQQALLHLMDQLQPHDWDRIKDVFATIDVSSGFAKLAGEKDMLGAERVQAIYQAGAERLLSGGKRTASSSAADFETLRKLWVLVIRTTPNSARLDPRLRLLFLQVCELEFETTDSPHTVIDHLMSLLETGGATDIRLPYRTTVMLAPRNPETLPKLAVLVCRAWHEPNRLSDMFMVDILREVRSMDLKVYTTLTNKLRGMSKAEHVYVRIQDCMVSVDPALRGSRFSISDVHLFLARPATSEQAATDLIERCLQMAGSAHTWEEAAPWLDGTVDLIGRLMVVLRRDLTKQHEAIVRMLEQVHRSALAKPSTSREDPLFTVEQSIYRFCEACVKTRYIQGFSVELGSRLFMLILRTSLKDMRDLNAVRRLYAVIRSTASPNHFKWKQEYSGLWRKLLVRSLTNPMVSTEFAMRLHADALAHGLEISGPDMLLLVRASTHAQGFSRLILTKRYLVDYLALPSTRAADRTRLLDAVTTAVTSSFANPDDLLDSIRKVVALAGPDPLPLVVGHAIVGHLALFAHLPHLRLIEPIIMRTEKPAAVEDSRNLFHAAIGSLLRDPPRREFPNLSPAPLSLRLGIAAQLYDKMLASGIPPTGATADMFIVSLAANPSTLSRATQMFHATVSAGELPQLYTVRKLLFGLYGAKQDTTAAEVKRAWEDAGGRVKSLPSPKVTPEPPRWAKEMAARADVLTEKASDGQLPPLETPRTADRLRAAPGTPTQTFADSISRNSNPLRDLLRLKGNDAKGKQDEEEEDLDAAMQGAGAVGRPAY